MFMTAALTLEQRIQKSAMAIMAHPKWMPLAGIIMIGKRSVSDTTPTAYTDGVNVVFGRAFFGDLTDAELRFVDVHEQYHKMYRHLTTWKWMWDIDPQLTNMACDYVINCKIVDADAGDKFLVMPTKGLLDFKYRGMDAAQVFNLLRKDQQDGKGKGKQGDGGFDEHGWEEAEALTEAEKRELAQDIDEAIRQGALVAGKTGSGGDRVFGELLEPQVDWREALREFITTNCAGKDYSTWTKPNRRFVGAGIYMPSGITERIGELVLAIDTSGSTYAPGVLDTFMAEAKSLCDMVKPDVLHIIYWDTKVCHAERYEAEELERMLQTTKPKGGGGTDVECVPKYMTENGINPQAVVVLTDGYLGGTWGTWTSPVLWCVLDNKSANPSCGQTVHINQHDMR